MASVRQFVQRRAGMNPVLAQGLFILKDPDAQSIHQLDDEGCPVKTRAYCVAFWIPVARSAASAISLSSAALTTTSTVLEQSACSIPNRCVSYTISSCAAAFIDLAIVALSSRLDWLSARTVWSGDRPSSKQQRLSIWGHGARCRLEPCRLK